jgi:hypothetical protein
MHPFDRFDERRISTSGGRERCGTCASRIRSRGQFRQTQPAPLCNGLQMGSRKTRDVAGDPEPKSLYLDRLTFIDYVIIDVRPADLGKKGTHCRMALRRRSERRRCCS